MTTCPACLESVPDATFCGNCGAGLVAPVTRWNVMLRPTVYATAHRERIWTPRVSSSYLPRLAGPMRTPFRIALLIVLIVMIACAFLRLNGIGGVTATLGWPLIFLIYVWETDVFRDIRPRIMVVSMVLGIASGVGWWLVGGKWLAGAYGVSTGEGLLLAQVLNVGFLLTLGGTVLMLLPALISRFIPVPRREALDGFVVATFGALWYQTASTTTVVAPQFAEGLINEQSTGRMFQDAITYGVVDPITTTAAAGLLGLVLWFTPRPDPNGRRARWGLIGCAALGVLLYLSVWLVESFGLDPVPEVALKIGQSVLALLLVRCAVQMALLHETPDPATGEPILCVHCERVVPDMPFCCACGAAARASSRTSRRLRRENPPVLEPS